MHVPKSYENDERVGYQGRGTAENQDIKGLIGDVYDTYGHLVYDKDYVSVRESSSSAMGEDHPSIDDQSIQRSSQQLSHGSQMINLDIEEKKKLTQSGFGSSVQEEESKINVVDQTVASEKNGELQTSKHTSKSKDMKSERTPTHQKGESRISSMLTKGPQSNEGPSMTKSKTITPLEREETDYINRIGRLSGHQREPTDDLQPMTFDFGQ